MSIRHKSEGKRARKVERYHQLKREILAMQKSGSNSNNPWNFSRKKLSVEKKLFDFAVKTSSVDSALANNESPPLSCTVLLYSITTMTSKGGGVRRS